MVSHTACIVHYDEQVQFSPGLACKIVFQFYSVFTYDATREFVQRGNKEYSPEPNWTIIIYVLLLTMDHKVNIRVTFVSVNLHTQKIHSAPCNTHTHTHMYTHTHTCTHTHTHTHTCIHTHMHTHTHMHPPTHTKHTWFSILEFISVLFCIHLWRHKRISPQRK